MLEVGASLDDAVTWTCPVFAIDLVSLSPELRKLVTFYSFLYLDLTPDKGVSSLIGTI